MADERKRVNAARDNSFSLSLFPFAFSFGLTVPTAYDWPTRTDCSITFWPRVNALLMSGANDVVEVARGNGDYYRMGNSGCMRSLMDLIHCKFGALYDQNYKNLFFQKSTTNRFEKEFSFPVMRAIPRNVQRYYLLAADHHLGNFWRSSAWIITITLCITRQIIHTFVESAMSSLAIITNISWKC